ncbi:MAG TPA: hypothetical protein DD417_03165 [Elusimicrobia bacterium]|nr:hypothetical protein [Elusimicrobiota bacterium]
MAGGSTAGVLGFYALELGIAFAFWRRLPAAPKLALLENLLQLVSTFRFILIGPLDVMSELTQGAGGQAAVEDFVRAMPGAIVSACLLTFGFYRKLEAATTEGTPP